MTKAIAWWLAIQLAIIGSVVGQCQYEMKSHTYVCESGSAFPSLWQYELAGAFFPLVAFVPDPARDYCKEQLNGK